MRADRRVVERFVGCSYGEATEALRRLDPGDAPMILTDEQWHVVSPADAWTLLSDHITRDDVEMLGEVTHDVLTESDPFYGMSGSERMWAAIRGSRRDVLTSAQARRRDHARAARQRPAAASRALRPHSRTRRTAS